MNLNSSDNPHLETILSIPGATAKEVASGHLSLSSISLAIGNIASDHGRVLGIYNGYDPVRNCGWVVLSARLRLLQPVPARKQLKLETWVAHIENGQLIREYRISENKNVLLEASHAFVLFDRTTRRIVIPPRDAREKLRGRQPLFTFKLELTRRAQRPAISTDDHVSENTVNTSDIDQNDHLNNSVYLRWAESHLEFHHLSTFESPGFKAFEFGIEFLAEANLGEKVQVRSAASEQTTYFLPLDPAAGVLAVSKARAL